MYVNIVRMFNIQIIFNKRLVLSSFSLPDDGINKAINIIRSFSLLDNQQNIDFVKMKKEITENCSFKSVIIDEWNYYISSSMKNTLNLSQNMKSHRKHNAKLISIKQLKSHFSKSFTDMGLNICSFNNDRKIILIDLDNNEIQSNYHNKILEKLNLEVKYYDDQKISGHLKFLKDLSYKNIFLDIQKSNDYIKEIKNIIDFNNDSSFLSKSRNKALNKVEFYIKNIKSINQYKILKKQSINKNKLDIRML